jgi:hypothetical protein
MKVGRKTHTEKTRPVERDSWDESGQQLLIQLRRSVRDMLRDAA